MYKRQPLYRRIPKRGFTNRNSKEIVGINLNALEVFEDGKMCIRDRRISVGDFWGLVLLPALYNGKISQRYDKMACGDSRGYVCGVSLPHGDGISRVSSHVV